MKIRNSDNKESKKIAVIGSGISGLSCAWLISSRYQVTLYEQEERLGGHSHTVAVCHNDKHIPVDTGFIVYNQKTYPNLVRLFEYLDVESVNTEMSFGVSLSGGLEYSGSGLNGLFAQRRNLMRPKYWRMITDILRFYRSSRHWLKELPTSMTLGELLNKNKFSQTFINDHILPMGAAIWSTPADTMLEYPALAYLRFCQNHGLLQLTNRPQWLTVKGGSRNYVEALARAFKGETLLGCGVRRITRYSDYVVIEDSAGIETRYDEVVLACHADTALRLLQDADDKEQSLLSAFQFQDNLAVLHSDKQFMPKSARAWSSWNYLTTEAAGLSVTYWMNHLQHIKELPLFVTLNPGREMDAGLVHGTYQYAHPVFDRCAMEAQQHMWQLQGRRKTWYCGAWLGYGFHEDGLQSGLAVAEALGQVRRPWVVADENDRLAFAERYGSFAGETV